MKSNRKIDDNNYLKVGIIFIVAGGLLGLDTVLGINFFCKLWPVLTLILGIGFIGIFKNTKTKGSLYIITGELLVLFSFLALFCNIIGWNIIYSIWPIFITFVGVITLTLYFINNGRQRIFLISSILIILVSIYFYLYVNYESSFWWTLLIFGGVFLIVSRGKNNE